MIYEPQIDIEDKRQRAAKAGIAVTINAWDDTSMPGDGYVPSLAIPTCATCDAILGIDDPWNRCNVCIGQGL